MGIINIASCGLWLGAVGQSVYFLDLFPRTPKWVIEILLLLPWLTVYTISFCRVPPCGPRPFRYALVFAMCWYAIATLLAEILNFMSYPHQMNIFQPPWRVMMYLGALSFVVFVRFCITTSRYEKEE